ncbi:hypothetical protein DS745_07545 [Anaerobacillus alkaliphilus]|uniref:UDP-2,4-diacetamido-2,4, 6-trideoxy-beta-L-altropyranose hydrolase n=1 Tax=Anaerobacillus alkaliphilus TaxID=1548597 RepID=A0A4Q0VUY8_9BACI|nr:hypothetical protein [Anaerobacillus alkaliphilus]RXJ02234.1 hypothetical protein DS745_07545 [Anaerobacillus alkaliphilus]
MRVLIFTEGGSQIGLGHISRCSSLYDELELRGIDVEFILHGDLNGVGIIKDRKYKMVNWLSTNFLDHYIREDDLCVVDSYLASEDLYRQISNRAKKSLFIDDNARINYPKGIVVNPSLTTNEDLHPISKNNIYLLDNNYVILRRPFIQVRRETISTEVNEVLITLGGSDIHNLTSLLLKLVRNKYPGITLNVVIGHAFANIPEIVTTSMNNINFYQNASAEEMKTIMLKSDVAITAAGQSIYELMATQTPFIPIKVIENQDNNVLGLKKYKLIDSVITYNDPLFSELVGSELQRMMDLNTRKELIVKYQEVVDGNGTKRIIDALVGE